MNSLFYCQFQIIMESKQQLTLRSYRDATIKNKKLLESISNYLFTGATLSYSQYSTHNFTQTKQKYQMVLAASREAIDRNSQLHSELQSKQNQLKVLQGRLHQNVIKIEGLSTEVIRATGNLKKQKKHQQNLQQINQDNERLKSDISKLTKKKQRLEREEAELSIKEHECQAITSKIQSEILSLQSSSKEQITKEEARIKQLENQIVKQRQLVLSLRFNRQKDVSPGRRDKSSHLQDVILKIRQQRKINDG